MEETSEEVLPREARVTVDALFEQFDALTAKLDAVDQEIFAWHRASETSQRLATARPGGLRFAIAKLREARATPYQFTPRDGTQAIGAHGGIIRSCGDTLNQVFL